MKRSRYCVLRIVAIVAAVFGIATCFALPARAENESEWRFVKGSPPVNIVTMDFYTTRSHAEDYDAPVFKWRHVYIYDREGRVVVRLITDEQGRTTSTRLAKYNEHGDHSAIIISADNPEKPESDHIQFVTMKFDAENRALATVSHWFDEKTADFAENYATYRNYYEDNGAFLEIQKDGDRRIISRREGTRDAEGRTVETMTTSFNEDGSVKETRKAQYEYTTEGKILKEVETNGAGDLEAEHYSEYDNTGRMLKMTVISYGDRTYTTEYAYEYTENSSRCFVSEDGGEPFERSFKEYNEFGETVFESRVDNIQGGFRTTFKCTYENRDVFNNWTKKTSNEYWDSPNFTVNGPVSSYYIMRAIIYYPELPDAAAVDNVPTDVDDAADEAQE